MNTKQSTKCKYVVYFEKEDGVIMTTLGYLVTEKTFRTFEEAEHELEVNYMNYMPIITAAIINYKSEKKDE